MSESPLKRIGYLVPEFPGQTHIMFWRELKDFPENGLEAVLISTKRPPANIVSHDWSRAAESETTYLFAASLSGIADVMRGLGTASLSGMRRCWRFTASNASSLREGLEFTGMAVAALRLLGLSRRRGFNHVHVHSCRHSAGITMFARWLGDLNYSMTMHGPLSYFGGHQPEKWENSAFALVITQTLLREIRETLGNRVPARIRIVGMGVDLRRFTRVGPYTPWQGTGEARLFSCGRLNPGKGHLDLIAAVALLRAAGLNVTLEIAGEDEEGGTGYRRVLERAIEDSKLTAHVRLLGAVREEDVIDRLQSAHVFVLASLAEPLGVAIMEAMAMRVPVVATKAGGVPELVDHGQSGLLVEPEKPDALAAAIRSILDHPEEAERLSRGGHEKIVEFTNRGSSAAAIAELLDNSPKT